MYYVLQDFRIISFGGEGEGNVVDSTAESVDLNDQILLNHSVKAWYETMRNLGRAIPSADFIKGEITYPMGLYFEGPEEDGSEYEPIRKLQVVFFKPGTVDKSERTAPHTIFEVTAPYDDQDTIPMLRRLRLDNTGDVLSVSDLYGFINQSKLAHQAQL